MDHLNPLQDENDRAARHFQHRRLVRIQKQQDYMHKRRMKLIQSQTIEIANDRYEFRYNPDDPHTWNYTSTAGDSPPVRWFASTGMTGLPGYILQLMGEQISAGKTDAELNMVNRLTSNFFYLLTGEEDGYGDDKAEDFEGGKEILHTILTTREDLILSSCPRTWSLIRDAFTMLSSLRLLRRFCDSRNSTQHPIPLSTGSNISNPLLKRSWLLYRALIRALHYRSLRIGPDGYGVAHVHQILMLTYVFLDEEQRKTGFVPTDRQENETYAQGIGRMEEQIGFALDDLAGRLGRETREMEGWEGVLAYTKEETVAFNLQPAVFRNLFNTTFYYNPEVLLDKSWLLWSTLLKTANDLETRNNVEHVEDVLLSKRVVYDDEFYEMHEKIFNHENMLERIHVQNELPEWDSPSLLVEYQLRKGAQLNRFRRDYLLLKDWSSKRPWKQLYLIIDTNPGEKDWMIPHINQFNQYISLMNLAQIQATPAERDALPGLEPGPSNHANIWSNIFQIHPLASTGSGPTIGSEPNTRPNVSWEGGVCPICQEEWTGPESVGTVMVELHCDHLYHFTCIRNYWDQEAQQKSECVLCRTSSSLTSWKLHEVAGITPEVADVFDYRMVVGEQAADANPNLTDTYYSLEMKRGLLLREWHPGNPEVGMYVNGFVVDRNPVVEMTEVRAMRRLMNRHRRELNRRAGRGFAGMRPHA